MKSLAHMLQLMLLHGAGSESFLRYWLDSFICLMMDDDCD